MAYNSPYFTGEVHDDLLLKVQLDLNYLGNYRAVSSATTLTEEDHIVEVTSGTFAIELPSAVDDSGADDRLGHELIIKNSGAGVVTLNCITGESIDGTGSYEISAQFDAVILRSNGAEWIVVAEITAAGGGGVTDHGALTGLSDDDHTQYSLADGTRAFSGAVEGVTPTTSAHLTTKGYVDGNFSLIQHYKDFSLPAGGWKPATTDGAEAVSLYEGTDQDAECDALAFDASTEEAAYYQFQLPEDYAGGVLRWNVTHDCAATGTGTIVYGLSGRAFPDGQWATAALGTERTITDTILSSGRIHKSPNDATGITLAGSPAAGQFVVLKLVVKTSGTLAVDAYMLNVQIQYQTKTTQQTTAWT